MTKFSTLDENLLKRWHELVETRGIPPEALKYKIKIVKDNSGKSDYGFGVIYNPYRSQRYNSLQNGSCPLCDVVTEISNKPSAALDYFSGFIVVPNRYPIIEGASLAISKGVKRNEKPMYTTNNLDGLADELRTLFSYADFTGFHVFHNSAGAGATIPSHEHWQLVNFGSAYDLTGEKYGFEAADYSSLTKDREIRIMSSFPFAHLIFNRNDPEKIVFFLKRLGEKLGNKFKDGSVPHGICHANSDVLIVPSRIYTEKGIGSGDMAGHLICKTAEEFSSADFNYCSSKLGEVLFKKSELDLNTFL